MAPTGGTDLATLLTGLAWTSGSATRSWILAMAIGVLVGIGRTTRMQWARFLGAAYVELFRNIPLLVQMFLWYFVVPEILPASLGAMIKQIPPPWGIFVTAVVCLGLYTSYREIGRGACGDRVCE